MTVFWVGLVIQGLYSQKRRFYADGDRYSHPVMDDRIFASVDRVFIFFVMHKKTAAGWGQPRSSMLVLESLIEANTKRARPVGHGGPDMSRWPLKV